MINLRLIETNFDEFNAKLKAKKVDDGVLKELLDTYNELKSAKSILENLQSIQNAKSKEVGILARSGGDVNSLKKELEENKTKLAKQNEIAANLEEKLIKSLQKSQISSTMMFLWAKTKTKMYA